MIAPISHGDAVTDSALDTLAVSSRGRNGATSMETQHVRADWMKKNTAHILRCSTLTHPCTLDNLLKFNDIAYKCTEQWKWEV